MAQHVKELGGLTPGSIPQPAPGPRIGRAYAPPFASLRKPQLLVWVVAAAEGDFARLVGGQHALGHLPREQCAERQIVNLLGMGELVDDGATVPQDPELRCGRDPADV